MNGWTLHYNDWNPDEQPLREALCVLGNGYFATRGAFEESSAGGPHYPGTYIAGGYNRLVSEVSGRSVENEDLVNFPNWLPVNFRPAEGNWFNIDDCEVLQFDQSLDLKRGLLQREMRVRDDQGRVSVVRARRIVHMGKPHLAALEWSITPENWSADIVLRAGVDGAVTNDGVARYRELRGDHLVVNETTSDDSECVTLVCETRQSRLRVAVALRHHMVHDGGSSFCDRTAYTSPDSAGHEYRLQAVQGETIRLEKVAAYYTARDNAITEPAHEAHKAARDAPRFEQLLAEHTSTWERLWDHCDIELDGDEFTQRTLRLHVFHLLQTSSLNTIDLDVGVPARGWHGEAYRGHIFWDELFIFPHLTLRLPEITRALIMYRYRRLPEARRAAHAHGYKGAMFPWQSGSNGREESQALHLNPKSGRWIPDTTHRQRHINAAVAMITWRFYEATADEEFLSFYGAEIILETAKFWCSIAKLNPDTGRYDIAGVVGPDEYHTDNDATDEPGLLNNAYTNVMASWNIRCAEAVFDALPDDRAKRLRHDLDIDDDERQRWRDIAQRLTVPFVSDTVIAQFQGYQDLAEFDWEAARAKHGDIARLDRVLEAEGDSPNRYKASKQADVLMLFYLFSAEELTELLNHMGYDFKPDAIPDNIDYYQARTSHGSTLSSIVHAWVLARAHREGSWDYFTTALRADLDDIQGGTTPEGIHLGAMSGTVDLVQRCYTGMELREGALWFDPVLPKQLDNLKLTLRFRGHTLSLHISCDRVTVSSCRGGPKPVRIGIRGQCAELREGQSRTVDLTCEKV